MTRLIRESSGASSWFDCCVFSSQAEQWFWFWVLGLALRRRCSAFCIDLMWRRGGKVYTARLWGMRSKKSCFQAFLLEHGVLSPLSSKCITSHGTHIPVTLPPQGVTAASISHPLYMCVVLQPLGLQDSCLLYSWASVLFTVVPIPSEPCAF